MSKTEEKSGRCLCGAIRITAKTTSTSAGACHCSSCRLWAGGPWMTVDCGTEVSFSGEENITVFDSSDWAERGFCSKCGSHLFYRLKESGQHIMSAGLFGDTSFEFDHQVFIDEKPTYYSFANQTHDMTGPELFAKFGAPE